MLASVLMMGLVAGSPGSDVPKGWRLPTRAELQNPMLPETPTAFTRVVADLDGDGDDDLAMLLKSTTSNAEALWVRLSDPDLPRWLLVNEISWGREHANVDLGMRIDRAEAGTYDCPQAEAVCQPGRDGRAPRWSSPIRGSSISGSAARRLCTSGTRSRDGSSRSG